MLPNCDVQSFTTQCVASCVSNLLVNCFATDTLHLCTQPSDCAKDTANQNCCALSGRQVCVSDGLKMAAALTCK